MSGAAAGAAAPSWWMRTAGAMPERPPLDGPASADVVIVGAGYTGLWTAYELKRAEPSLDVLVLEAERVGHGASGRNGGWLSGHLAGDRARYAATSSRAAVVALLRTMHATIDHVAAVLDEERIDADLVKGGSLTVATTALELQRQRVRLAHDREWGFTVDDARLLDGEQTRARIAVAGAVGGYATPHCARIHPGKLVAGLAAACERRGVRIAERTPVRTISPGRAVTDAGDVTARWVVRATEAYSVDLPHLHRSLVPLTSSMIVTEPLPHDFWAEVGWDGRECLMAGGHRYVYVQRTADDRIALGGDHRVYSYGSRTAPGHEIADATVRELRARLVELFPRLAEVAVEDAWSGIFGVPRDWCTRVEVDPISGLCSAGGYVGNGVTTANLAARTLRDGILGRATELTQLPWSGRPARRWEPEPLRWLGVRGAHAAYALADRREAASGRASRVAAVADAITGH